MTKPHDICCPDPKAAEVRAMRHKLKNKACKDPHGSAMEMVEQYYLKKDIENNRPLYGDNFPSKVQLAAQMNAKRSKKRPRHPTDMDFEFNHQYVESDPNVPEHFLQMDIRVGNVQRHLLFASKKQLKLLKKAHTLYMDSTFKIVKEPIKQLFSIHVFVKDGKCMKQVSVA